MDRILITGAAGEIGSVLRAGLRGLYPLMRLTDVRELAAPSGGEEIVQADLADLAALREAMRGIECVVHLGGVPREGPWQRILDSNIIGTYNVFEIARECGVRRVIFASSNHVVGYHRVERIIGIEEPPRPDSRYGVSKVFGEALGRLYADKHGLSVACLRIGSFRQAPGDRRQLSTWISHGDTVRLVRAAIDAPPYHFLVVYGVSANTRLRWRNPDAARIGYVPQDNAEDYASRLTEPSPDAADPALACHGGSFCALEFDGELANIK